MGWGNFNPMMVMGGQGMMGMPGMMDPSMMGVRDGSFAFASVTDAYCR